MARLDGFRDPRRADSLIQSIRSNAAGRCWRIMEVCGGQTHTLLKYGIPAMLEGTVEFVHGPGCPVCVTPVASIDRALAIAARPEVLFCSFGDMLRVPGGTGDLLGAKSTGADVRIIYSPLDCLQLAARHPDRQVVFFAVGFETTAPANAMLVFEAKRRDIKNLSVLVSHYLVPPAVRAVLQDPGSRVDGLLAAGHVCTVMGTREYEPLAQTYHLPIVVTGFEPIDVLEGTAACVRMLRSGRSAVENAYPRAVRDAGNPHAQRMIEEVFEVVDRAWHGFGIIPGSGLKLRPRYADFDAELRFELASIAPQAPGRCLSGEILRGQRSPLDCVEFGTACTPDHPLGATMASAEGACAAYFLGGQNRRKDSGALIETMRS